MSQAGIDSVQSWLSLELEQRGIDAVIYTRHVLDLFLNSRYTTDLQLAEKEANIFANLPPGTKKRKSKQKYCKRSNSLTAFDKIALKKEMAANCLRSASEDISENINCDSSIETLIEKLYHKLNNLHLLSDVSSSSDEGHVGKRVEKRRESYHDAFPRLFNKDDDTKECNINHNAVNSIWNGQKKFGKKRSEAKSECIVVQKNPVNTKQSRVTVSDKSKRRRSVKDDSSSQDEALPANNKGIVQQPKAGDRNKRVSHRFAGKRRQHSYVDTVKKSPSRYKRKNGKNVKPSTAEKYDFDKENANERKPRFSWKNDKAKRKFGCNSSQPFSNPQFVRTSFFDNIGVTLEDQSNHELLNLKGSSRFMNNSKTSEWKHGSNQVDENKISHLYSAGLAELYQKDFLHDRPCSKWFRDPDSGCLEFEPAYKSRPSSEVSPSTEVIDDEPVSESWLWCPSPSLWEDDNDLSAGGAQSRLETIYKPSLNADSSSQENATDEVWNNYESIFSNVSSEVSDVPSLPLFVSDHSVSGESKFDENSYSFHTLNPKDKCDKNGNYLAQPCLDFSQALSPLVNWTIDDDCQVTNLDHNQQHEQLNTTELCRYDLFTDNDSRPCFEVRHWNPLDLTPNFPVNTSAQSRKEIWLQNSDKHAAEKEVSMMLAGGHMSASAYEHSQKQQDYSSSLPDLHFREIFTSFPMDEFVSLLFEYKLFEEMGRKWDCLPVDSLVLTQSEPAYVEEDEDSYYMTTLVKQVVDVVTLADDHVFEDNFSDLLGLEPLCSSSVEKQLKFGEKLQEGESSLFHPPIVQDSLKHSRVKHDSTNSNTSLLAECITENEAWKTSLRIGNAWQAISGIRPVDIVYSEKNSESDTPLLQPSSLTHFRPIHASDHELSDESITSAYQDQLSSQPVEPYPPIPDDYIEYSTTSSEKQLDGGCSGCSGCDMKIRGLEQEIGNLLYGTSSFLDSNTTCQNFRPKFRKLGEDKSMQTTFEQHIRLLDTDICKSLSIRPPKANSR